ncbi:MAG: ABC transporter permease [Acidobacteria bacterium]|nr:ABC transporter permease [Acidobacteriota bacterium]MBI3263447.1 ABC transporter permease [Acidobacteriota bacterium]
MYQLLDAVRIALESIWANKLRSFMMVLGNIVAVMSIIAVVSLIQGMNTYVGNAIITQVGAGTFRIDRMGVPAGEREAEEASRRNPIVTLADLRALRGFSPIVSTVMAESGSAANITYHDVTLETVQVRGVSAEYQEFSGYNAALGRLPSPLEIERNRPVALIGWETAQKLFKDRNAVDELITLAGTHFRVVGVNEKKGSLFGQSQDDFAVIPLGKLMQLFGSRRSLRLTVKPPDPELLSQSMEEARLAMRIKRKLRPSQEDNFGLFTSDTVMDLWKAFSRGAFAVLIGIVSLSLVVGGIVIMNIMLMVVTERTREIGLRKALGARKRDIVWQVLTESTSLSLVGGIVGTALGFGAALLVQAYTPLPADIQVWSVVLGLGMTALVGLFFGLYPAVRAANLDPIEALRRE